MRKQREILEHQADAAFLGRDEARGPGDLLAVDEDAAGGGAFDAGGKAQKRGLAAAGGAQQAHDFARRNGERDIVQRDGVADSGARRVRTRGWQRTSPPRAEACRGGGLLTCRSAMSERTRRSLFVFRNGCASGCPALRIPGAVRASSGRLAPAYRARPLRASRAPVQAERSAFVLVGSIEREFVGHQGGDVGRARDGEARAADCCPEDPGPSDRPGPAGP